MRHIALTTNWIPKEKPLKRTALLVAALAALSADGSLTAWADSGSGDRRAKILERYDTNQDGAIDRDEFTAGRDDWFAKLDSDADGVVTQSEFEEAVARFRESHDSSNRHGPDFSKLDTDGDGNATSAEFEAAADRLFTRFDRNGDGVLSPDDRNDG
jgi:Ca2+-binding EF-hand superfamily protein